MFLTARLGGHENNEFRIGFIHIAIFDLPYYCSHSNIFESDVYKTNVKLIICVQNLQFRDQILASKNLATRSWLPDPGYHILITRSWLPDPSSLPDPG